MNTAPKSADDLLQRVYDAYKDGNPRVEVKFDNDSSEGKNEKRAILSDVRYLEEKFYVKSAQSLGLVSIKLTANGIDYMESQESK